MPGTATSYTFPLIAESQTSMLITHNGAIERRAWFGGDEKQHTGWGRDRPTPIDQSG